MTSPFQLKKSFRRVVATMKERPVLQTSQPRSYKNRGYNFRLKSLKTSVTPLNITVNSFKVLKDVCNSKYK